MRGLLLDGVGWMGWGGVGWDVAMRVLWIIWG